MTLHPDIIDAMVEFGKSAHIDAAAILGMVQVACRAAFNLTRNGETVSETHETRFAISPQASARRAKPSTPRVQAFRARQKAKRETLSTGVSPVSRPPLSLVENIDSEKEREAPMKRMKRVSSVSPLPVPLPEDFQPDNKTWTAVIGELGETAAVVMMANFWDHYGSRPQDMRTPSGWQATLRKWARSERKSRDGPARLPLMRPVRGGQPAASSQSSPAERVRAAIAATLARRRESG